MNYDNYFNSDVKTTSLHGYTVNYRNLRELEIVDQDVFGKKHYHFSSSNDNPCIIDAGAHIGLSTLYFKTIYPNAKICCFEPNPDTFSLLKANLAANHIDNVQIENLALSDNEEEVSFFTGKDSIKSWSSTNSITTNAWYSPEDYHEIKVKTAKLSSYCGAKVDFLKLDIEGMELRVLRELNNANVISNIDEIIMEYHGSDANPDNSLGELVELLESNGYFVNLYQDDLLVHQKTIKRSNPYWLMIRASR